MESENPYRPPQGEGLEVEIVEPRFRNHRTIPENRWQAFNRGFESGSAKATNIGLAIMFSLEALYLLTQWCEGNTGLLPSNLLEWLGAILSFIFINLLVSLTVFAIPGAIIMGLIETIRFRK